MHCSPVEAGLSLYQLSAHKLQLRSLSGRKYHAFHSVINSKFFNFFVTIAVGMLFSFLRELEPEKHKRRQLIQNVVVFSCQKMLLDPSQYVDISVEGSTFSEGVKSPSRQQS